MAEAVAPPTAQPDAPSVPACDSAHIPFTHRVIAASTFFGVLISFAAFVALLGWLLVFVGGCAVGYPVLADGKADLSNPSIGVGVGSVNQVAAGGLGLLGSLTGNPAVLMLAAVASHLMGQSKGWDQREQAATVQSPLPEKPA